MISQRTFNDALEQINVAFAALASRVEALESEVSDLKAQPKTEVKKKTLT